VYPFEMPVALHAVGYTTASIGKDHFGWNTSDTRPPLDPKTDTGDVGSGTPHGYQRMTLYDGLVGQPDDGHQWFNREAAQSKGGTKPGDTWEKGWPTLNMNGWMGAPFVFAEYLHPTAWVGQQAVDWITAASATVPWFLKISFHRPHSPYDPPARVLNATTEAMLPVVQLAKNGQADDWDSVFHGGAGHPTGCGPQDPSAWCGVMPLADQQMGRRSYYANVAFIDEWVGKIIDTLASRSFNKNTFIIWGADHGDGQADHSHWRKGFPYQFSANVPMTFVWPESYPSKTPRGTVSPLVTELRDVFPTMLDAAGAMDTVPAGHKIDGISMLCLLEDPSGAACKWTNTGKGAGGEGWRPWLDLEHTTCYNASNHWSALTDGKMKYIFNADTTQTVLPKEQLFNLTADPGENTALHANPSYAAELAKWRGRMVAQFEEEGRGEGWVKDGVLQLRKTETYGPNYPGHIPHHGGHMYTCENITLSAGDRINLETNAGTSGIKYCQDVTESIPQHMSMVVASHLCVAVAHASAAGAPTLALATCDAENAAQEFTVPGVDKPPQKVKNIAAGLCITTSAAGGVAMAKCAAGPDSLEPEASLQDWVLGASGRLCTTSGCLSVVAGQSLMSAAAAVAIHSTLDGGPRARFLR
jgi:arylsulfatase